MSIRTYILPRLINDRGIYIINVVIIYSQIFVGHKDGKELCCGTDSFNNHLLHIACKNGSNKALKVCTYISKLLYIVWIAT